MAALRDVLDRAQSEGDFQAEVIKLAKLHGWACYHTFDSRRSESGFPDLVLVRGECLLFAELKAERGRVSRAQADWLAGLRGARRHQAVEWRPSDWDHIAGMLREGF